MASMRRLLPLLLLLALALAAAPSPASAARLDVRVGIGDQNVRMFDQKAFKRLKLKRVRYFIRWDAMRDSNRVARESAEQYVQRAKRARMSVLLHISSDDLTRKKAKLPQLRTYRRLVTRLVKHFRALGVREFGARNEANHDSQATWRSPKRAAEEYKIVYRAAGKRSTVVALDVLDQSGVERYISRFYRALGRTYRSRARLVGIHNYSDVNRVSTRRTRSIINAVRRQNRRAQFWLTETGGVVQICGSPRRRCSFPHSKTRAAKRLRYLFRTVAQNRRSIKRVYVYNWTGLRKSKRIRFDAGLTNPNGSTRPAYRVLRKELRRFKR
jgi:hypothetical protein